eukprot:TRINITY_DN65518_c0_g1_i1.p2 TRINITY_DN65518_c0_g1~~TRINITY_DN65518_c0_g1_i1.p2  ORF type:complete len:103 (+),score=3.37 TRINITY_DN65518_c0_g1_i1:207-515(+)
MYGRWSSCTKKTTFDTKSAYEVGLKGTGTTSQPNFATSSRTCSSVLELIPSFPVLYLILDGGGWRGWGGWGWPARSLRSHPGLACVSEICAEKLRRASGRLS